MNPTQTESDLFGPVIDVYSQRDALDDGILIVVSADKVTGLPIFFTSNLFEDRQGQVLQIISKGLELLKQPDSEDSEYMKLRVIEKDSIWVVWNPKGFTFMKPEDY